MGDSDLAVQDSERHGLTKGMGAASFLVIWVVMMIAMMFPTAAPMILVYERVQRDRHSSERAFTPTWAFVGAYLLMWALFGVLAYLGSLAALGLAQEIPWIMINAARIGGGILVLAGKWCYLYRAIDGDGNLVDSMLSDVKYTQHLDLSPKFG